jgi:hypothetical protein
LKIGIARGAGAHFPNWRMTAKHGCFNSALVHTTAASTQTCYFLGTRGKPVSWLVRCLPRVCGILHRRDPQWPVNVDSSRPVSANIAAVPETARRTGQRPSGVRADHSGLLDDGGGFGLPLATGTLVSESGRTALLLGDPGGEPLDWLLSAPMEVDASCALS